MRLSKEQIADYVNKAKKGDKEAFSGLYQDNVNQVYYICLKFLKNEENARDVTQDTFVTAIEKIGTLANAEYFTTWVNHIAVNKCKNILLKNNRISKEELYDSSNEADLEETNSEFIPEEYVTNKEKRSIIMDIIDNKLSDVQRIVVLLFYYEGETVENIAQLLDCSEGTVKSRLSSARKLIRKAIEDKEKKGIAVLGVVPVFALSRIFMEEAKANTMPQTPSVAFTGNSINKMNKMEVISSTMIQKGLGLKIAIGAAGVAAAVGIGIGIANIAGKSTDKNNAPTGDNITISREETSNEDLEKETGSKTAETDNTEMSDADIINYIIENDGKVPLNVEEKDLFGVGRIANILVEGFKNLDAESMKPFIDEKDYNLYKKYFDSVLADEEACNLWKDTIGRLIYYPDSQVCVLKNIDWVYKAWYTDCYRNNEVIPESDASSFSKEYLMNIYDKYYDEAPYTVKTAIGRCYDYEIEDGYLKIDMTDFLDEIGYAKLNDIFKSNSAEDMCFDYSIVIMGKVESLSLGYDYICGDENPENNIYNIDAFLDKDIDTIVDMTKDIDDKYKDGIYWAWFNTYYLDEENRSKVKEFIDENCFFLRGLGDVTMWRPSDYDFGPLKNLNERDKADLQARNLNILESDTARQYPGFFKNNFSMFYDVVELMKYKGLFD